MAMQTLAERMAPVTDRELVEELLRRHEVEHEVWEPTEERSDFGAVPGEIYFELVGGDEGGVVQGYSAFFVRFGFTKDGVLTQIGAWE